jgi:hypothetical protein
MKIKTADLTGAALDWAVAKAEYTDRRVELHSTSSAVQVENGPGSGDRYGIGWHSFRPSTDWAQGGPIIERECILFMSGSGGSLVAYLRRTGHALPGCAWWGPTHLVAAMRCFVASKLGDEVDVPEELV